jgi:hypothetical protein
MPSVESVVRGLPFIILWALTLLVAAGLGYRVARRAISAAPDPQRRIEQLSVLNQVGQALSASHRLDELLERIYQQVSRLMDTSLFYVALYDSFTDVISFPLAMEPQDRQRPDRIRHARAPASPDLI